MSANNLFSVGNSYEVVKGTPKKNNTKSSVSKIQTQNNLKYVHKNPPQSIHKGASQSIHKDTPGDVTGSSNASKRQVKQGIILPSYLQELKIYSKLPEIFNCVSSYAITMVNAGTGSGKTVGIPRTILEAIRCGLLKHEKIIVSVPTVLNVIFQFEYACKMNPSINLIGKSCGGKKSSNFNTAKLIYATTQSVVNYLKILYKTRPDQINKLIVMIDEAHHPSTENYVIHGLCNWLLSKGFMLKVIIATATPCAHPFYELNKAKEVTISSTQFPVTVCWNKKDIIFGSYFEKDEMNYAILSKLIQVIQTHETGDILIFTSGENEVELLCNKISKKYKDFAVFPLYSSLSEEEFESISKETSYRKVVVSTNVAESGVTIDGVTVVIDSITHKKMSMKNSIRIIEEVPISQASSMQRRGRAGRTAPGFYYPLCTEKFFNSSIPQFIENQFTLIPKHIPVINLISSELPADEILLIPKTEYHLILAELSAMKLIDTIGSSEDKTTCVVTELGQQVSRYPLTIKSTVILLNAIKSFNVSFDDFKNRCDNFYKLLHMVIVVSMVDARVSCPHMFNVPREERDNKNAYVHSGVFDQFIASNDITVLVNIFSTMMCESLNNKTGSVNYRRWCKTTRMNGKFIEMAYRLFNQVWYIVFNSDEMYHEDFDEILQNSEIFSKGMITIISSVYCERIFTVFKTFPRLLYIDNRRTQYSVDNNTIATMWQHVPKQVIAISETLISIPGKVPFSIIGICVPLESLGSDNNSDEGEHYEF